MSFNLATILRESAPRHPDRSGGAPIPAEVLDEFERTFGIAILEGYGLSETASTTFNPSAEERRVYSVGKPIWGVEVEIRDVLPKNAANKILKREL
jgi:long-subunit acyl-CoA synthetase (AMP-forming)